MPTDTSHQHQLREALHQYNLDAVLGLTRHQLKRPEAQAYSNLRPIFEQAQHDGLNLLDPPPHFHDWLQAPLRHTRSGPNTARANTVIARLTTLRTLYEILIDEGLLQHNPARGCPAPSKEHKATPLPSPHDIQRLLAEAHETDRTLYAALTLIYQHAFQVTELLALRWRNLDFSRGELRRARTVTPLGDTSLQALVPLLTAAGGPLNVQDSPDPVFPYPDADEFRHHVWTLSKRANLTPINPSDLRKASLRDHGRRPSEAGFSNADAYEEALKHARHIARKGRG